jgi:ketosteroid isomerase-like protein
MLRLRPFPQVLLTVLSAILLAAPLAALPKHGPGDPKQQILNLEQQWRTATLNCDVALMDKLLSDDYVGISWTGQMNNKSSQLDRLRNRTLSISQMNLFDQKVKVVDSVAIVTSRAEVMGTNDGEPINDTFRYTRVYQRLPSGTWKITNFESTRVPRRDRRGGHGAHAAPGTQPPPPPR